MYTTPVSTLASQFQTDPQKGLTDSQVLKNRQTYGPNVLPRKKGFTIWSLIINQFADIIVWILFGAAILSFMLQEYIE
jgi:magnesium-transporting ATPase (P-type)